MLHIHHTAMCLLLPTAFSQFLSYTLTVLNSLICIELTWHFFTKERRTVVNWLSYFKKDHVNWVSNRKQNQRHKRNRKISSFSSFDLSSYMVGQGSHGVQLQTHSQLPHAHQGLRAGHKLLEAHLSAARPLVCVQKNKFQSLFHTVLAMFSYQFQVEIEKMAFHQTLRFWWVSPSRLDTWLIGV